ncbi:hypothetical protein NE604_10945 [Anaerofustis stercorihominis]|uniref:Uncharacterized protein n=1 Tax=Anaerofustis stercorihominis DSM 17244 TaxID=445971 RepID=B1CC05_9FIRM|nr:hypothetical protein [Anaerofustis stercorihominis]EDS71802.1 hypothetical protein ANASTE_01505 [Anaerofustis stercorihominis DSM 17244]MCQ4796144.1 hypothetical protein [Anaerofustis stercorihominis]
MYLIIVDFMMHMSFGKHLYFIYEWLIEHLYLVGFVGFLYGCVLFYGTVCAKKYIPKDFNDFVFSESAKILKLDSSISIDDLSKQIYTKWVEHVPNLPKKYKVPTKKGFWIETPTVKTLEEDLNINRQAIVTMFKSNKKEGEVAESK